MSRFLKMMFSAWCLFSLPALAGTICIKNKLGVEEGWTADAKNSWLIKTSEKCESEKVISVPVLSAENSKPLQPKIVVAPVSKSEPATKVTEIQPAPVAKSEPATKVEVVQTSQTIQSWSVSRNDQNFRLLIDKWTKSVGWTLIWAVDKDIPLESSDTFSGNFKTAVRALLSSTELSDFTIKPCFHSNNVIRVVKETTKCNPNEG